LKKPFYKRWWFIALVIVFVIALIGSLSGGDEKEVADDADNASAPAEDKNAVEEENKETDVADEEAADTAPETAKEEVPREYKAALKKAETYAKTMHMSKAAIYDQLVSEYGEGFPAEAAQSSGMGLERKCIEKSQILCGIDEHVQLGDL
jgi:F0F1-type ATP synthase membrane subunit b/b'